MAKEQVRHENDQSLAPLVAISPLLKVGRKNRITCPDRLPTPVDEHGIPRRVELMRQVLSTIEAAHIWTGEYDLHHMAWPATSYKSIIDEDDYRTGSYYRGASSLKVIMPRQMHNYVHAITEPPELPDEDIMRAYALEHYDVYRLYHTVSLSSYEDFPDLAELPFDAQEELRQRNYLRKLEQIHPGELGVLPDLGYLAALSAVEARPVLRGIAKVKGISNRRRHKKAFLRNGGG